MNIQGGVIMFESYEDVVTIDEFMEMLCIGRNKAYELLNKGEIKALRFGRKWRIPRISVENYIYKKCQ
jgi:excisionase family DNA binding protein